MSSTRIGSSEFHNVSAWMGGVASQEVIKLLTHQYTPLNHTLIYNGLKSTSDVFCF
jgi:amyloid beta precursor protein binding protein 1